MISNGMQELGIIGMASQYVEYRDAFIALMDRERSIMLMTDSEQIEERIKQRER